MVDAVNCALSIQRSAALPPDQNGAPSIIVLRIGINLGDVIIEADDIYGDGVNIAARLEPLAEPGGICISSIVNESIGNRVEVHFRDGGEVSVKNIERPIRVWRWHPGMNAQPIRRGSDPATRRSTRSQSPRPRRSPFCRSPTCRAIPSRSISPTGSAKTSLPTCRRLPV